MKPSIRVALGVGFFLGLGIQIALAQPKPPDGKFYNLTVLNNLIARGTVSSPVAIHTFVDAGTVLTPLLRVGTNATANKLTSDDTTLTITGPTTVTGALSTGAAMTVTSQYILGSNASYSVNQAALYNTAPTISSGFGSSPSIVASNGTAFFRINVGTGGSASSGVIGLPNLGSGTWGCWCTDITTASATVFITKQTGVSVSGCTVTNYDTTGAAAAWVASDILYCHAWADP